jgi:hypothetical protein
MGQTRECSRGLNLGAPRARYTLVTTYLGDTRCQYIFPGQRLYSDSRRQQKLLRAPFQDRNLVRCTRSSSTARRAFTGQTTSNCGLVLRTRESTPVAYGLSVASWVATWEQARWLESNGCFCESRKHTA